MNENELKSLWQTTNKKLENSLLLNTKNIEDITRLKIQNFLSTMKPIKIFTLVVGIIWVIVIGGVLGSIFLQGFSNVNLYFFCSATMQVLLTIIAIAVYVYQLDLIHKIDFSEPILVIQEKLSKLKVSTLNVTRILFLQLPFWTTFYWNEEMLVNGNLFLWILQGIITLTFAYLSVWLFFNIKYENRNKKWFQFIFSGKEWQPIIQSMDLLSQMDKYQE